MKRYVLAFCLAVFSAAIGAQPADPCAGLVGSALGPCQGNQQKLQQQQLEQQQQELAKQQKQLALQQQQLAQQQQQLAQQQQQLQQQQERQNQLNDQQRRQLETMQHQNELLGEQLAHEKSPNPTAPSPASDDSRRQEAQSWKAENPWYGSNYARTQFAMRYANQLQKERPDLVGRPFLDAISAKVKDTFGATK
jgi:TolA-binding protein